MVRREVLALGKKEIGRLPYTQLIFSKLETQPPSSPLYPPTHPLTPARHLHTHACAGNYSVSSDRGAAIVEINGNTQPLTGALGTIGFLSASSSGSGRNILKIYSEGGDVQLSQLPSLV